MTEEIKQEKKEQKCECKELKAFLLMILASFLGALVALCIYGAATRPQLPPPMINQPCPIQKFHKNNHHFDGERHQINRADKDRKDFKDIKRPELPKKD